MSAPADNPPAGPQKNLLWVFAAVGVVFILYKTLIGAPTEVKQDTGQVPPVIDVGSNQINQITGQDKDAALVQFSKKLESMTARLDRAEKTREEERRKQEAERRKLKQENDANARALAEAIAKLETDIIDKAYQGINAVDKSSPSLPDVPNVPPPSGGLTFDEDFDLGSASPPTPVQAPSASLYGPNYTVLRPQAQATYQGKSGGAEGSQSESALFSEMSAPDTNAFEHAATRGGNNMDATFDEMYGRNKSAPVADPGARPVALSAEEIALKKKLDTYVVEAFSFVEVTPLHGQACPIGANSPGSSGAAKVQAKPIVLPARGIFRGPNGVERDLGTIHLMGLCSGRRTSSSTTGRAMIRIEQLSYWDSAGGAQMVPAVGYIVDTRDNEADVYGKLDKASGRTLALQSAAAAAAAYATTLSSAEFTTSSTLERGASTATSQLTGNAPKAAIAQGIGAMFQKISERFEAEADAAMDTVLVEPGIKLRFVTELPIRVLKPLEPLDIDASMYDTLI